MRHIMFILILLFCSLSACGKPIRETAQDLITETHTVHPITYAKARMYLFGDLHYDNGVVTDVYCENNYTAVHGVGQGKIPDPQFVNCEHTWPQSKFGDIDVEIKKTDLHHLFPSESRSNTTRSNNPFGDVSNGPNVCNMSALGLILDTRVKGFEPPLKHRGNAARAMFYFSLRYRMPIDPLQEKYLRQWHKIDPVDEQEIVRNRKIEKIQGNSNIFIDHPEFVESIADF
jgi:deoxyribonuclease-1